MNIHIDNLSKVYVTGKSHLTALLPITTYIAAGEFVCLLGPSGCGKSTFLKMIADQLRPTTGSINLDNSPPEKIRKQKGIAWMAQNPALLPWKNVRENIELSQKVNSPNNHPMVDYHALLNLVDLADFDDAYPSTLSGGMQQRVALARTLAIGASLWLMDEPFAALDEFSREMLSDEVLRLWSIFHPTVIWVTHSIIESVRLADRILVMSHRPGTMKADVQVKYPRPRDLEQPYFIPLVKRLRGLLNP